MSVGEASRVKEIQFSVIRTVAQWVEDLAKKGRKVIDLSIGRPDFDTPRHIKEAAKRALDAGKVHYVNNFGIMELRQALAGKITRENGFAVRPEEVMVTVGAVEALTVALMAFVEPGDEVLIVEPSWVNYVSIVRLCGGIPVFVSLDAEKGFSLPPSRVAEKVSPRTKAIMYASRTTLPGRSCGGKRSPPSRRSPRSETCWSSPTRSMKSSCTRASSISAWPRCRT